MRFGLFSLQDCYPELGVTPAAYFARLLDRMRYAEALGFGSYWLAEHHFRTYGLNPSPAVVLAAAARETSRLRLGTAVSVLPLHHPVQVAEEYALVDVLSQGRLNFGVGSGASPREFAGLGVPVAEKRARFDEALALILQAWSGERFSYRGAFWSGEDVHLPVRPLQHPQPPVWVAVLSAEAAYHVGRRRLPMLGLPYATAPQLTDMAPVLRRFAEGYAEAGGDIAAADVPLILHTYVADTDAQAWAEALPALRRYFHGEHHAPHGSVHALAASGLVAVGCPDTVATSVDAVRATGATTLLCLMDFGGLADDQIRHSMRLLTQEVAPRFRAERELPASDGA